MMHRILLRQANPSAAISAHIPLPSSKSESNRALVIATIAQTLSSVQNISEARDTQTLLRLLATPEAPVWDVLDAGTTMRFLTAYTAIVGTPKIMTGTPRMCQRPIAVLVEALQTLGANIVYTQEHGFPPLKIGQFRYSGCSEIAVAGNISSQYISALAMIAPCLPNGLTITFTSEVTSWPYIAMTLELMAHFGVKSAIIPREKIYIPAQKYQAQPFAVESDWSAASYWYSLASLHSTAEILLKGLKNKSLQGDSRIVEIMKPLGISSEFTDEGVWLRKTAVDFPENLCIDFTDCPDLAQTLVVLAAAQGCKLRFSGLESLRIKETDRIAALQHELAKFGVAFEETEKNGIFSLSGKFTWPTSTPQICTYDDHRMAMAFAPLAVLSPLTIENPAVVNKSYPSFWTHLSQVGLLAEALEPAK